MCIYDSIGGEPVLEQVSAEFTRRLTRDPLLAPFFMDIDAEQVQDHLSYLLTDAFGGETDLTRPGLAALLADVELTDEDFTTGLAHLVDTLTFLGVDDATLGEIGGVLLPLRDAVVTSPAGHPLL